jgi:hypothetical protein
MKKQREKRESGLRRERERNYEMKKNNRAGYLYPSAFWLFLCLVSYFNIYISNAVNCYTCAHSADGKSVSSMSERGRVRVPLLIFPPFFLFFFFTVFVGFWALGPDYYLHPLSLLFAPPFLFFSLFPAFI